MNSGSNRELSEQLTLEAHLYSFGEEVISLCARESDCQLSTQDAYQKIRQLWLELKQARPEIVEYIQNN